TNRSARQQERQRISVRWAVTYPHTLSRHSLLVRKGGDAMWVMSVQGEYGLCRVPQVELEDIAWRSEQWKSDRERGISTVDVGQNPTTCALTFHSAKHD